MNFTKNYTPVEKSQMKLSITVRQDEVQNQYALLTKKYSHELQIPGFRKGKVPVKILEQKFGDALRSETFNGIIENVLQEIFATADKYERPLPYSQPAIDGTPDFKLDSDMSFTVVYDVRPNIAPANLEGFTVSIPDVTVADEDIDKELKHIQERNALVIDCAETDAVQNGSIVTIDFVELDESGEELDNTRRNDFVFTVGNSDFRYELDDDLIGMKKGEEKIIERSYPADHTDPALAGKTKKVKVHLTALKRKDLPAIDDELAQDVSEKYATLADLKADISKNLSIKIQDELERRKNNDLLKQIAEANPFELPESMIAAELEGRWEMLANQMRMSGAELEKLTAGVEGRLSKASAMQEWRADAELRLKTRLIVEKLLEERNITVTPEEVEAEYPVIAERSGNTAEEVKKYYTENVRQKEYLIDDIKEKKLYAQLFEKSKLKKTKKMSLEQFLNEEATDAGKNA